MFDPLFSFMDTEPFIGLSEDETSFVIQADIFYDVMQKIGMDRKPAEGEKIEVPIEIVLSLLSPREWFASGT